MTPGRQTPEGRRQVAEWLECFAIAAPGLSPLVAGELRELGLDIVEASDAGVAFRADTAGLYRANLQARIASRVVVRAALFRAAHFSELEKHARLVPWDRWVAPGSAVAIRVTTRKSRLYHTGGVAQRLLESLGRVVKGVTPARRVEDDDAANGLLLLARIERDTVTISVDSSGDLLHRRGYRQAVAKAPLRETLAAAMLMGAKWSPGTPLVDPCCGSGTIPIEAALLSRRIPPGWHRHFAFERWPSFVARAWAREREVAGNAILPSVPAPIAGSDRDAGAIRAAISNAERAGVSTDVEFSRCALSRAAPRDHRHGLLIANPPYGERLGERSELRDFYAAFGKLAAGPFQGWKVALLASDRRLVGHTKLGLQPILVTNNGGIDVTLFGAPDREA